jgi:hypothetical protein
VWNGIKQMAEINNAESNECGKQKFEVKLGWISFIVK